jgi:hypothetical protein
MLTIWCASALFSANENAASLTLSRIAPDMAHTAIFDRIFIML